MTKIFVDTNVIIDVLGKREDFISSGEILSLVEFGEIAVYISALSLANAHYILSKSHDKEYATAKLKDLDSLVTVVDLTNTIIQHSLSDITLPDFEDGLQIYSAIHAGAQLIITRDAKGFVTSPLPIMTPLNYMASRAK